MNQFLMYDMYATGEGEVELGTFANTSLEINDLTDQMLVLFFWYSRPNASLLFDILFGMKKRKQNKR